MKHANNIIRTLTAVIGAIAAISCSRPEIIPDNELADIFHDAFITNAYVEHKHLNIDSLDIYEPIFAKYGYTVEDVRYTIGNFSKRKNARLGDVVERAIKRLEEEGLQYEREVAVLDTIDNIARRTFRRTIYADTLIRASRLKDTDLLKIVIGDLHPGDYKIDFDYVVDSLDNATNRRAVFALLRRDSSVYNRQQQNLYRNNRKEHVSRQIVADTSARCMKINLMEFSQPRAPQKLTNFGITVTNLKVVYTPTVESALDSLYQQQLPVRIFFEDFYPEPLADIEK